MAAVGVLISTLENPQSFNNFSQVNTFAQENGEGLFCFPLDFTTANVTSLGLKIGRQRYYPGEHTFGVY